MSSSEKKFRSLPQEKLAFLNLTPWPTCLAKGYCEDQHIGTKTGDVLYKIGWWCKQAGMTTEETLTVGRYFCDMHRRDVDKQYLRENMWTGLTVPPMRNVTGQELNTGLNELLMSNQRFFNVWAGRPDRKPGGQFREIACVLLEYGYDEAFVFEAARNWYARRGHKMHDAMIWFRIIPEAKDRNKRREYATRTVPLPAEKRAPSLEDLLNSFSEGLGTEASAASSPVFSSPVFAPPAQAPAASPASIPLPIATAIPTPSKPLPIAQAAASKKAQPAPAKKLPISSQVTWCAVLAIREGMNQYSFARLLNKKRDNIKDSWKVAQRYQNETVPAEIKAYWSSLKTPAKKPLKPSQASLFNPSNNWGRSPHGLAYSSNF